MHYGKFAAERYFTIVHVSYVVFAGLITLRKPKGYVIQVNWRARRFGMKAYLWYAIDRALDSYMYVGVLFFSREGWMSRDRNPTSVGSTSQFVSWYDNKFTLTGALFINGLLNVTLLSLRSQIRHIATGVQGQLPPNLPPSKNSNKHHFNSYHFDMHSVRWPVGATVNKNINYLQARDNYLWPGDSFLWARLTISGPEKVFSGPEKVSLAQRYFLWAGDNSDVKSSRPSCPRGQNFVLGLEDLSSACPRTFYFGLVKMCVMLC